MSYKDYPEGRIFPQRNIYSNFKILSILLADEVIAQEYISDLKRLSEKYKYTSYKTAYDFPKNWEYDLKSFYIEVLRKKQTGEA